jgi:hypothetical protein
LLYHHTANQPCHGTDTFAICKKARHRMSVLSPFLRFINHFHQIFSLTGVCILLANNHTDDYDDYYDDYDDYEGGGGGGGGSSKSVTPAKSAAPAKPKTPAKVCLCGFFFVQLLIFIFDISSDFSIPSLPAHSPCIISSYSHTDDWDCRKTQRKGSIRKKKITNTAQPSIHQLSILIFIPLLHFSDRQETRQKECFSQLSTKPANQARGQGRQGDQVNNLITTDSTISRKQRVFIIGVNNFNIAWTSSPSSAAISSRTGASSGGTRGGECHWDVHVRHCIHTH